LRLLLKHKVIQRKGDLGVHAGSIGDNVVHHNEEEQKERNHRQNPE
jgi:hypothetical protein